MDPRTITKLTVDDQTEFEDAYKRIEPEFATLSPDEIAPINLDIASAVATVLYLWMGIVKFRDTIDRTLIDFDIARFDKMLDYAMALGHANTMFLIATQPPDDQQAIYAESAEMRQTLHTDTLALVRHGLIKQASIKGLMGSIGYKNVAVDLQILASVLKANWSIINGKCGIQLSELDHALKLSAVLFNIVGFRDNGSETEAEATNARARAYTLFTRAYDDARRAIIFLRWHEGDADSIAPALHPGRSVSKKKAADDANASLPAATPTVNSAQPATSAPAVAAAPKSNVDDVGPFAK